MGIINKLFKSVSKPIFPIVDTRSLKNDEIKFLLKEFKNRQEDLNQIFEEAQINIPYENLKFHELITARFAEKLLNKNDLSKIELEILNAMFQKEGVAIGEFKLISEIMSNENSDKVMDDLKQQGFEFIENVGFIRIQNS
ncbi:hypothetical protein CON01_24595 [Bacillus thuringiensis]|uniref:Uncharacterized protein n=1 Tax=Bacillus thuringiensis TaxID=1428 RepID=A0A9X6TW50_BACTU|nr:MULTISPECIES: hypothetical protein [Bacillus cereus group]MBG9863530.1 hypothetical protein [Bacillus cereus]MBG9878619.1 hypothetical protein [Bacillus tropicus]MBG9921714.1 hypothetical protein [Bacillus tropicus]MBJ8353594.1 hypothetical protein [Bacillus mycoides]MED2902801.1 hypothetical protein [Bacillus tropicus]